MNFSIISEMRTEQSSIANMIMDQPKIYSKRRKRTDTVPILTVITQEILVEIVKVLAISLLARMGQFLLPQQEQHKPRKDI